MGRVLRAVSQLVPCELALHLLLLLLSAVPLAAGCGGGIERVKMSGKVTYMDQPVVDGMIRFVPKAGTEMPLTIEPIRAGQYDTSTSGGVPVGTYRVEIFAYHPDDPIPTGPGACRAGSFCPRSTTSSRNWRSRWNRGRSK